MTDGPSQSLSIAGQPSAYGDTFVAIDLMKGVDAFRYSDPTGPVADPHVPLSALRLDASGLVPPKSTVTPRAASYAIAWQYRAEGPLTIRCVHVVPFHSHVSALGVPV